MTKIALALVTSLFMLQPAHATDIKKDEPPKKAEEKAPAKKEKACIDKAKDGKPVIGKDGKPEQICKEVKVHEKLEGHKVSDKK
jgi:hypothetical protein